MIDRSSRPSKPITEAQISAAAAVRCCHGNCHDVTSTARFARNGDECVGDAPEHVQLSDVDVDRTTVVPTHYGTPTRSPGVGPVDDCELAADAEVCWLLRHGAAVTPLTPESEPAIGGLSIDSTEAPLVACIAPDFDCVPPYLATYIPARVDPCYDLHLPSRTVCHRDTIRRPCLNFDKMQV